MADDLESFLGIEPRDHAQQGQVIALRQTQSSLQGTLIYDPPIESLRIERLCEVLVDLGVPDVIVHAVEDAGEDVAAGQTMPRRPCRGR